MKRETPFIKHFLYGCLGIPVMFMFLFCQTVYPGDSEIIKIGFKVKIKSQILKKEMHLSIHLPNDYETSTSKYPVLVTFQTHFEQVSGAIKNLYDYNLIPRMMMVSIENYEYGYLTPTKLKSDPNSGQGDLFLKFFKEELFPYLDSTYRTHPYRIVFSNSWGGMFAAYSILAKPDVFNAAIASVLWIIYDGDDKFLLRNTENFLKKNRYRNFLYFTADNEKEIVPDLEKFADILRNYPKEGLRWEYHLWPEEDHTSSPYRSVYWGLRTLFAGWYHIPEEVVAGGLEKIKKYESAVNLEFGYDIGVSTAALGMAGQRLKKKNKFDMAIPLYKYAIEKSPDNPFAHVSLGRVYEENRQLELAEEVLEKGYNLAIEKNHPQVKWVKGHLERVKEKIKKMIEQ